MEGVAKRPAPPPPSSTKTSARDIFALQQQQQQQRLNGMNGWANFDSADFSQVQKDRRVRSKLPTNSNGSGGPSGHAFGNGLQEQGGFTRALPSPHQNGIATTKPSQQFRANGLPPPPPAGPAPSLPNGSAVATPRMFHQQAPLGNGHLHQLHHHHHHHNNGLSNGHHRPTVRNGGGRAVDLSQGSTCDTTPATPDSLAASSLACSAEEEDSHSQQQFFLLQQQAQRHGIVLHGFSPAASAASTAASLTQQRVFLPPSSTTPPHSLNTLSPSPGTASNNNNNGVEPLVDLYGGANGSAVAAAVVAAGDDANVNRSSSLASSCSLGEHWRASNGNLSCQLQRDNLIEELTTPVPRLAGEDEANRGGHATSSGADSPVSSAGNAPASSASSPGSVSPPRAGSRRFLADRVNNNDDNGKLHKDFSSSTLERDLANLKQFAESSSRASEVVKDMLSATGTMRRNKAVNQQQQQHAKGQKIYESLYPQMVVAQPGDPAKRTPSFERLSGGDSSLKTSTAGRRKRQAAPPASDYTLMKEKPGNRRRQVKQDDGAENRNRQQVVAFATLHRPPRSSRRRGTDEARLLKGGSLTKRASGMEVLPQEQQPLFSSHSQDQLPLCDVNRLQEPVAANGEGLYSPLRVQLPPPNVTRSSGDLLQLAPPGGGFGPPAARVDSSSDDDDDGGDFGGRRRLRAPILRHEPTTATNTAPSPKRRTPFTIEGAMSALKRRASLTGRSSEDNAVGSDKEGGGRRRQGSKKRLWWGGGVRGGVGDGEVVTRQPEANGDLGKLGNGWTAAKQPNQSETAAKLNSLLASRLERQTKDGQDITCLDEIIVHAETDDPVRPNGSAVAHHPGPPPPLPPRGSTDESRSKPPPSRNPPRLPAAFPGATDEDDEEEEELSGDARNRRRQRRRNDQRSSKDPDGRGVGGGGGDGKQQSKKRRGHKGKAAAADKANLGDSDGEARGRNDDDEGGGEHEMEYCDPCYCYGKCCLDVVASIFCVSLL